MHFCSWFFSIFFGICICIFILRKFFFNGIYVDLKKSKQILSDLDNNFHDIKRTTESISFRVNEEIKRHEGSTDDN